MKVCFITSEIFLGKRRGGFGKLVRDVGRELVKRGFDVSVICWHEPGEDYVMKLDGMEVLSYPYDYTTCSSFKHLMDYTKVIPLIKRVDADVYISIDCLIETYLAQKLMPNRKHVIWVQDPFDWNDYRLLGSIDPNYRISRLKFWITTRLYERAYKRTNLILTQAKYYIPKIARLYGVNPDRILYLPNPVEHIPDESSINKSKEPAVCFLGRMDPQKRYWLFFELAKNFPDVDFIAVGKPNPLYEELYRQIVEKYRGLKKLKITGFVSEEEKSRILSRSWILCLPSIREGLPIAFLEAMAHKCALLSSVNPDQLVSKYGYYALHDDFARGLRYLLEDDKWREHGEKSYKYVKAVHSINTVISKLVSYLEFLNRK